MIVGSGSGYECSKGESLVSSVEFGPPHSPILSAVEIFWPDFWEDGSSVPVMCYQRCLRGTLLFWTGSSDYGGHGHSRPLGGVNLHGLLREGGSECHLPRGRSADQPDRDIQSCRLTSQQCCRLYRHRLYGSKIATADDLCRFVSNDV